MPSGVIQSSDDRGLSRSSLAASFSQSAGVFFGKSAIRNYVTQRGGFATRPVGSFPPTGHRHPDRSRAQRGGAEGPILCPPATKKGPSTTPPFGRLRSG